MSNRILRALSLMVFAALLGPAETFAQDAELSRVVSPLTPTPIRAAVAEIGSPQAFDRTARLGSQAADWQAEYNEALRRKSAGKKKMLIGAGLSVGGALIAGMAGASCDVDDIFDGDGCEDELDLAWLGYLTSIAGGGALLWGGIEYFDANGDLNRLESRRPRTSASIKLSDDVSLQIAAGHRSAVGLRATW